MTATDIISIFDHLGVFIFALSGGLLAVRKEMDIFGVIVLALLPAVGGGTLRDLLLDEPVFWLNDHLSIILAVMAAFVAFFAPRLIIKMKSLVWMDAAGMALFTVIGASKAYDLGHNGITVIIMGTLTATAGGLIRDVVSNNEPLLLKEDIYATAAIVGALAYWLARELELTQTPALLVGAAIAFIIRACAIRFKLSAPKPFSVL